MRNATRSRRPRSPKPAIARRRHRPLVARKRARVTQSKPKTKLKTRFRLRRWMWVGLLLVILALPLWAIAHTESRAVQCNRISAVVNQAARDAIDTGRSSSLDKVGALQKASESDTQYAKQLETVQIKDETLKRFQSRFIKMYQDRSNAGRGVVEAAQKKDIAAVSSASQVLQNATVQEAPLVEEFNHYCKGK